MITDPAVGGKASVARTFWRRAMSAVLWLLLAWLTWMMWRNIREYWPMRDDAGFLNLKTDYLGIPWWKAAFYVHVFTSLLALLAGLTQFWPGVLRRWPGVHRWVGRLYVLDVCLVTGPAGLVMACYANGGIFTRLAFGILAVLWITTTALAYAKARRRQWSAHRAWMIRSYALTLSAPTLRLWSLALALTLNLRPMDGYRAAAWLGFVPNLLLAEWVVRRQSLGRVR